MLDNIQKSLFEIQSLIKNNSDIKKMLYYDTENALSLPDVSSSAIDNYIFMGPVFDITEEPYNKNSFITIVVSKMVRDEENNLISEIKINVLNQLDLWKLENYKIRTLEITNVIIKILDNKKLSSSHKVYFTDLELVILNEDLSGYSVSFALVEGGGLENEF